jgi:hypothetical protein
MRKVRAVCGKALVAALLVLAVVSFPIHASASRVACETGHWIDSVTDDGEIIKLEDGSVWEVAASDAVTSMTWVPSDNIIICNDQLINSDDNETVSAAQLR